MVCSALPDCPATAIFHVPATFTGSSAANAKLEAANSTQIDSHANLMVFILIHFFPFECSMEFADLLF
jgi:hypothetical protein